jgi:hypothetical protein
MKKFWHLWLLLLICLSGQTVAQTAKSITKVGFQSLLTNFKSAIQKGDQVRLGQLLNYPFYTNRADGNNGDFYPSEPISKTEFKTYSKELFHTDVRRLFPQLHIDELSEIDNKTKDTYYLALLKTCDPGSKLYEAYLQCGLANGISESYFAFVFGRIKGNYRVIAYYGKWPVKG